MTFLWQHFFFFAIASIFLQVKILLYIGCLKHITRSIAFCVQLTSAFVEHFYLSSNLWYEFLATCKWVAWTVIFFFFVVVSNKGLQWKQAGLREPEVSMYYRCIMNFSSQDCSNFGQTGCRYLPPVCYTCCASKGIGTSISVCK